MPRTTRDLSAGAPRRATGRRRPHRPAVALACALALPAAAVLSACSSADGSSTAATTSGPPAPAVADLLARSQAAVKAATSAHMQADLTVADSRMSLTFAGDSTGQNETIDVSSTSSGSYSLVVAQGESYVKGDNTFWQNAAGRVPAAAIGKYVHIPAGSNQLGATLTPWSLFDETMGNATATDFTSAVGSGTVNGTDCWTLTRAGGSATVYLEKATGLPLKLDEPLPASASASPTSTAASATSAAATSGPAATSAPESGTFTLSSWNAPVTVTAPPADQVVESSALAG